MRTSCVWLLLAATVAAQKMPLVDGSGRQLQLFDMAKLRGKEPLADAPRPQPIPGLREPRPTDSAAQRVAEMLARFIDPPLGPGDDFKALGDRWLALLGTPAQIASAERLFRLAVERCERTVDVQIQLLQLDDKDFVGTVKKHLVEVVRDKQVSYESVLDEKGTKQLETALDALAPERFDAPRLLVFPLQVANASVLNQTAYVKDFTVTRVGDELIADPVVDTIWDGNITEVCATFLPDGMLGVTCDVAFQELQKPIPTFETTLGKGMLPVKIQLPRLTGTRLQQTAVLAEGSMVVLATRKVDGRWLVALVRAQAQPTGNGTPPSGR